MKTEILKSQIEFFEKFGQMLNSGVPLNKTLEILSREIINTNVKKEIVHIINSFSRVQKDEVKLVECFNKCFFNESTIAMIETGLANGQLDYVCIKIANCLRAELSNISDY